MKLFISTTLITAALTSTFIIACSDKSSGSKTKDIVVDDASARSTFDEVFYRINSSPTVSKFTYSLASPFDIDLRIGSIMNYDQSYIADDKGRKFAVSGELGSGYNKSVLVKSMDYSFVVLSEGPIEVTPAKDDLFCRFDFTIPLKNAEGTQVGAIKGQGGLRNGDHDCSKDFVEIAPATKPSEDADTTTTPSKIPETKKTLSESANGMGVATLSLCNDEFASICDLKIKKQVSMFGDVYVEKMELVVK